MDRTFTLGLIGIATAASIGIHAYHQAQPRYQPRNGFGPAQYYRGAYEWLSTVRGNGQGIIDPMDRLRMAKAVAHYDREQVKSAELSWNEMGPDNIGGRVRALCVDPNNHQKIWAGSVSGGLFRSMDGANTWQRITSFQDNLIVSSIAVLGNGHLYVATGCNWESPGGGGGSGFVGAGIFRSDDDGASFSHPFAPSTPWNGNQDWALVNRIKADPSNPNRLYIASYNPGARVYDDASNTLSQVGDLSASTTAFDVDLSGDGQTILYSMGGGDAYRSTDGGSTFEKLDGTPGVGFPQSNLGRLELAISPDNGNYMYAFAATGSGRMNGAWASTDRGDNWFRIWPGNLSDNDPNAVPTLDIFRDNHQGLYDCAIAVRPGHPEEVWLGGVEIWKTTLNGQPNQLAQPDDTPGCFFCVHADVHEIVFADATTAYIGCDGGVYKTPTSGDNFYACNHDLNITQYYSVGYDAKGHVAGGAQDNGSTFVNGYGNTQFSARGLTGGDGFDCDLSQMDTTIMFTSIYGGEVFRSNDYGNNFGTFYDSNVPTQSGPGILGVGLGDFYTNFRLFENPHDLNSPDSVFSFAELWSYDDSLTPGQTAAIGYHGKVTAVTQYGYYTNNTGSTIHGPWRSDTLWFQDRLTSLLAVGFTSSQGIYVTRDAMNFTGEPAVPAWGKAVNNAGGNVNCMEFSADGDALFFGTSEGDIWRVTGFSHAYAQSELVYNGGVLSVPDRIYDGSTVVTGLAPDPSDPNRLVATFGSYGGTGKIRITTNALDADPTFTNIWNVPSEITGMPVYDAIIHKDNHDIIVAGTEFGIWATDDGGQSWTHQTNGIDNVPVFSVRQQTWNYQNNPWGPDYVTNPNVIYAGTHGRGFFRTDDLLSVRPIDGPDGTSSVIGDLQFAPNPANTQSVVSFALAKQGDVTLNLYDLRGALVRTITRKNLAAATQHIPVPTGDLGMGTYIVQVGSADQRRTGRLVVAR